MKSIFDKNSKEAERRNPNNYVNQSFDDKEFEEINLNTDTSKGHITKRYEGDVHVMFLDASFRQFEREAKEAEKEKIEQKKREAEFEKLEFERLEAEKEAEFKKRTRSCPGYDSILLSFYV
jgi:hypothetical protein